MENQMVSNREYGIDLLRIVSMFAIVVLHVIRLGGILESTIQGSTNWWIAETLNVMTFCAVNTYALISGYVGVSSKFKISNIIYLWMQVTFYTTVITVIVMIFDPNNRSIMNFIKAMFPILSNQYWYFTAYAVMFFFIPFLNKLINKLEVIEMLYLCSLIIILFSVVQTVRNYSIFYTNGYDCFWLMFLYIIGGCVKKSGISKGKSKLKSFFAYITSVFITLIWVVAIKGINTHLIKTPYSSDTLIQYTSPTILMAAISLLFLFANIVVGAKKITWVKNVTPLVFGVYLIHTNKLLFDKWGGMFAFCSTYNSVMYVLIILGIAIAAFVVCLGIEYVRLRMFEKIKLRLFCEKVEEKICSYFKRNK